MLCMHSGGGVENNELFASLGRKNFTFSVHNGKKLQQKSSGDCDTKNLLTLQHAQHSSSQLFPS